MVMSRSENEQRDALQSSLVQSGVIQHDINKHKSLNREDKVISEVASSSNLEVSSSSNPEVSPSSTTEVSSLSQLAWTRSLAILERELDSQVFGAYIRPLKLSSFDNSSNEFVVSAPSNLVRNHVDATFRDRISKILSDEMNSSPISIKFDVDKELSSGSRDSSPRLPYVVVKKTAADVGDKSPSLHGNSGAGESNINARYTFSNFVVGNSNQFCHAAAMQVAEKPGMSYNPLFIYGGVGLGKTHLLHAIGNSVLERNPRARVLYMSSEAFTNELIQALRNSKMDEFKTKLRNIEVLLIDDIQFMVGKERTQEEFFHTFNVLYSAKHQIVITSDKIPSEIPQIEERLYTRFSWGLIADLQAPDFETRVAILNRRANSDNFSLPEEVAHLIAEKVSSNVRELEGALTRLHAISSLQNTPINKELALTALKHLFQPKPISISVDDIKKVVSTHFGIKVSDIISKRRTKNLSFPRHIAMYLCRKHTTCSYPEIGGHFGGRDHSSVIHAANVVATKVKNDLAVKAQVSEVERILLGN